MNASPARVRSLRAIPVNVPLVRPRPTAGGVVESAPLVRSLENRPSGYESWLRASPDWVSFVSRQCKFCNQILCALDTQHA